MSDEPIINVQNYKGTKTIEYKNKNNRFHREDGPAVQSWYANGVLNEERWCINGGEHRLDGPSYRGWDEDGRLKVEVWKKDGEYHRIDGPAYYFRINNMDYIRWFKDGEYHRIGGPANIVISNEGKIHIEGWYENGELHRIDGPAQRKWGYVRNEYVNLDNLWYYRGRSTTLQVNAIINEYNLGNWEDWTVEDLIYFRILLNINP